MAPTNKHTKREQHTFVLAEPQTAPKKHTVRVTTFLKFLDANPGQWAIFRTYPKKGHIARHRVREYRRWYGHRGYEFTHDTEGDTTTIYGRKIAVQLADNTRG